jgi:hypothetical protein
VDAVLPAVATIAHGVWPARRSAAIAASSASGRIACCASCGTTRMFCRPKPASSAALSTELWLCAEV